MNSGMAPEILQRLAESQANAEAALARVKPDTSRRAETLIRSAQRSGAVAQRVMWLRQAATAWAQPMESVSACKPGCSHCCHVPVSITDVEARLIGQRVGIAPQSVPDAPGTEAAVALEHLPGAPEKSAGYTAPCPFLANDRCSIYEHRPLACRAHARVMVLPSRVRTL
jgi:Fe-S-cluster containining protein